MSKLSALLLIANEYVSSYFKSGTNTKSASLFESGNGYNLPELVNPQSTILVKIYNALIADIINGNDLEKKKLHSTLKKAEQIILNNERTLLKAQEFLLCIKEIDPIKFYKLYLDKDSWQQYIMFNILKKINSLPLLEHPLSQLIQKVKDHPGKLQLNDMQRLIFDVLLSGEKGVHFFSSSTGSGKSLAIVLAAITLKPQKMLIYIGNKQNIQAILDELNINYICVDAIKSIAGYIPVYTSSENLGQQKVSTDKSAEVTSIIRIFSCAFGKVYNGSAVLTHSENEMCDVVKKYLRQDINGDILYKDKNSFKKLHIMQQKLILNNVKLYEQHTSETGISLKSKLQTLNKGKGVSINKIDIIIIGKDCPLAPTFVREINKLLEYSAREVAIMLDDMSRVPKEYLSFLMAKETQIMIFGATLNIERVCDNSSKLNILRINSGGSCVKGHKKNTCQSIGTTPLIIKDNLANTVSTEILNLSEYGTTVISKDAIKPFLTKELLIHLFLICEVEHAFIIDPKNNNEEKLTEEIRNFLFSNFNYDPVYEEALMKYTLLPEPSKIKVLISLQVEYKKIVARNNISTIISGIVFSSEYNKFTASLLRVHEHLNGITIIAVDDNVDISTSLKPSDEETRNYMTCLGRIVKKMDRKSELHKKTLETERANQTAAEKPLGSEFDDFNETPQSTFKIDPKYAWALVEKYGGLVPDYILRLCFEKGILIFPNNPKETSKKGLSFMNFFNDMLRYNIPLLVISHISNVSTGLDIRCLLAAMYIGEDASIETITQFKGRVGRPGQDCNNVFVTHNSVFNRLVTTIQEACVFSTSLDEIIDKKKLSDDHKLSESDTDKVYEMVSSGSTIEDAIKKIREQKLASKKDDGYSHMPSSGGGGPIILSTFVDTPSSGGGGPIILGSKQSAFNIPQNTKAPPVVDLSIKLERLAPQVACLFAQNKILTCRNRFKLNPEDEEQVHFFQYISSLGYTTKTEKIEILRRICMDYLLKTCYVTSDEEIESIRDFINNITSTDCKK